MGMIMQLQYIIKHKLEEEEYYQEKIMDNLAHHKVNNLIFVKIKIIFINNSFHQTPYKLKYMPLDHFYLHNQEDHLH
jgi:hypothetical protein